MGYESKIYIAKKHSFGNGYNEVLATYDLGKMGYEMYRGKSFRNLFTIPLEGSMYMDDGNTEIHEDCYGDDVEGAKLMDVILWLNEFMKHDNYPRVRIFYDLLKSFQKNYDAELICYHYGY